MLVKIHVYKLNIANLSRREQKVNIFLTNVVTHGSVEVLTYQLQDGQKALLCLVKFLKYIQLLFISIIRLCRLD